MQVIYLLLINSSAEICYFGGFLIIFQQITSERVADERLRVLADFRYLSDGTKIGVRDAAGNGYEYLGSLIYRRTPNGLEIESTDFAAGRIIKTSAKYDLRYFVRDYLGSVRAIVNTQGQRLEAIDYMPYGSRWKDPMRLVTDNRFLFNGKEWQPTGDLDVLDYGARQYDPELGRWFNPDPAMQFLNPYTFCANDPVNLVDLNGCEATPHGFILTDQGEIGAFLDYLANNGILIDMDNLMNFLSVQNAILRNQESGGGNSDLYVRLPTMVVERFGPMHLKKLQQLHEDFMRRLNHLLTMNNPVVKGIHSTQTNFLRTTIDLAGFTLGTMGQGLQYSSIALASTGLGAEAGAVLCFGKRYEFNWYRYSNDHRFEDTFNFMVE